MSGRNPSRPLIVKENKILYKYFAYVFTQFLEDVKNVETGQRLTTLQTNRRTSANALAAATSSSLVWEAISATRKRAEPLATVGYRIAGMIKPRSNNALDTANARNSSPIGMGMIAETLGRVSIPRSLNAVLKSTILR